jgi:hypothetical protein
MGRVFDSPANLLISHPFGNSPSSSIRELDNNTIIIGSNNFQLLSEMGVKGVVDCDIFNFVGILHVNSDTKTSQKRVFSASMP